MASGGRKRDPRERFGNWISAVFAEESRGTQRLGAVDEDGR